ncbi:hypothetical protein [Deinococcus multiflagellatus]|nr:hypothetical protein [Deinococcus multiflagellatus]MBZ9713080.1 hypothetical protein [Deinococcus multiflagellatus]
MKQALSHLWDSFLKSPLGQPAELARVGLVSYTGCSGCHDWDGTGDFYGTSEVWLKRPNGEQFFWKVGLLFEQGEFEGEHWEQGGAYSYVSIGLDATGEEQVYYRIGEVQLPNHPLTVADLAPFSEKVRELADTCFDDLTFVFQRNGFKDLVDLAQEKFEIAQQRHQHYREKGLVTPYDKSDYTWQSNPLRSNHHA